MATDWTLKQMGWANAAPIPDIERFHGREDLLRDCRAAWGLGEDYEYLENVGPPLHFRLEGPPGVGKNEIVYELVRRMRKHDENVQLYVITGHDDMTPEDLSVLLVPGKDSTRPVELRASPLATAIHNGAVFFFDEINRVPERALSPLASVLDPRIGITSAMTNIEIRPKTPEARKRFRFCCALNPELANSGYVLPEYIDQRTLPAFQVVNPGKEELLAILRSLGDDVEPWLRPFSDVYDAFHAKADLSVRQALSFMTYVRRVSMAMPDGSRQQHLERLLRHFMRQPETAGASLNDEQT